MLQLIKTLCLQFEEQTSAVANVRKGLISIFDQVTEVLNLTSENEEFDNVVITYDARATLTGYSKFLAELQCTDITYLEQPDTNLCERYFLWIEVTEQQGQFTENALAKHLASSEILNEKYLSLVPKKISHIDFWKRLIL